MGMRSVITLFFLLCFTLSTEIQIEDDIGEEAEHYSWDLKPIDPYENTEIIIDPYASQEGQLPFESDPWSAYRSSLSP